MVKAAGSICVFLAGSLVWYMRLSEQRDRRQVLHELVVSLQRMEEHIRLTRMPLPPLFLLLAEDCRTELRDLFCETARGAERGEDWRAIWQQACRTLPLSERERQTVCALEKDLRGDEHSVCNAVLLAVSELKKSKDELERVLPEERKRTSVLCFSASALLVILLI